MENELDELMYVLYDEIKKLTDNRYLVKADRLLGVINRSGEIIIPIKYGDIRYYDNFFVASKFNARHRMLFEYVYDNDGNEIPFEKYMRWAKTAGHNNIMDM